MNLRTWARSSTSPVGLFIGGLQAGTEASATPPDTYGVGQTVVSTRSSPTTIGDMGQPVIPATASRSGRHVPGVRYQVLGADGLSAGFIVSLGVRGHQSAILFTRLSGTPLGTGRYRILDRQNGADEVLALVIRRTGFGHLSPYPSGLQGMAEGQVARTSVDVLDHAAAPRGLGCSQEGAGCHRTWVVRR
jgi:hypothetical protein